MILLDTNVIVDALDKDQANHRWAKKQFEDDGRQGAMAKPAVLTVKT